MGCAFAVIGAIIGAVIGLFSGGLNHIIAYAPGGAIIGAIGGVVLYGIGIMFSGISDIIGKINYTVRKSKSEKEKEKARIWADKATKAETIAMNIAEKDASLKEYLVIAKEAASKARAAVEEAKVLTAEKYAREAEKAVEDMLNPEKIRVAQKKYEQEQQRIKAEAKAKEEAEVKAKKVAEEKEKKEKEAIIKAKKEEEERIKKRINDWNLKKGGEVSDNMSTPTSLSGKLTTITKEGQNALEKQILQVCDIEYFTQDLMSKLELKATEEARNGKNTAFASSNKLWEIIQSGGPAIYGYAKCAHLLTKEGALVNFSDRKEAANTFLRMAREYMPDENIQLELVESYIDTGDGDYGDSCWIKATLSW